MSEHEALARSVLEKCRNAGIRVATAESCTGGMIAAALTGIAGSSEVFERGFVTYSNDAKMEMLGVPAETLQVHGAVSEETARAMAEGAIAHSPADVAVAVTGIAGPGGGSAEKPVGTVWFSISIRKTTQTIAYKRNYDNNDRALIRSESTRTGLELLLSALG